jgi:hypothetical protein
MTNKKLTIISVSLLLIFLIATFATLRQQAQDKSLLQKDEPTVVQTGQITEKGREYSKEIKKLNPDRKGHKLSELSEIGKRKGNKQEVGISLGVPDYPTIGSSSPITGLEFLSNLSCKADAVVIGIVQNKSAHLTEDETFVYTEYEFLINDVLKNNTRSPIEVNGSIQITRPGGLIKLDNQIIRVVDQLYEPLQTKKEYLLFLNYIPAANGYIVSSAEGDFLIEDNSLKTLSKLVIPKELTKKDDSQVLRNNLRNSALSDCNKKIIGGGKQ